MNKPRTHRKLVCFNLGSILVLSALLLACGTAENTPPKILDVGFPARVQPGEAVRLTVIAVDPDGDDTSLTYNWSLFSGKGIFEPETSKTVPSTTYVAPDDALAPGEVRVQQLQVEVVDIRGDKDFRVFSVRVVAPSVQQSTEP